MNGVTPRYDVNGEPIGETMAQAKGILQVVYDYRWIILGAVLVAVILCICLHMVSKRDEKLPAGATVAKTPPVVQPAQEQPTQPAQPAQGQPAQPTQPTQPTQPAQVQQPPVETPVESPAEIDREEKEVADAMNS